VTATSLAVVFLLLAGGSVAAGFASAESSTTADILASRTPTPTADPASTRISPAVLPDGTVLHTCLVSQFADADPLGVLRGSVVNADTGEDLFERDPDYATKPGSALATLTATAAVTRLGGDYQLMTTVTDGNKPGSIVLVGGGDATLSQLGENEESVYTGAPKLTELATETLAAYAVAHPGEKITEILLDATYWDKADRWNSGWNRSLQTDGHLSEVTALQVDGDRADPTSQVSPRSTDPIGRAGTSFALALGLDPDKVSFRAGTPENGAPVLAEARSAPVSSLVQQMLSTNDATLAEMLARVVSVESGFGGSAASLQQAIPQALQAIGLTTSDVAITDGSGLSTNDAVATSFFADLMVKVGTTEDLSGVLGGLAISGQTGSLANRFTGENASAAGSITGASGAVDGARSLTGIMTAADGSRLAFAFVASNNIVSAATEEALDTLVAGVQTCGSNLSNN